MVVSAPRAAAIIPWSRAPKNNGDKPLYFSELSGEQARQLIDGEQAFAAYKDARLQLDQHYAGSMSWKTVGDHVYLYRKRNGIWKSLGPKNEATEVLFRRFRTGRQRARDRVTRSVLRLNTLSRVNRALRVGRMPRTTAKILRALAKAGLIGSAITVVGTNALFAYERLAGVHIGTAQLATGDIDLLFDARAKLKLLGSEIERGGLAAVLREADKSFAITTRGSFRAVNDDGYMVDLVTPLPARPMAQQGRRRIGAGQDLEAVEIEGLNWLVNSPKLTMIVIDERGFPLEMVTPDPRAFALHKAWLSERADRDPVKRGRDAAQARLVASLVAARLPHLRFDDPALEALPRHLRERANDLIEPLDSDPPGPHSLEPDW